MNLYRSTMRWAGVVVAFVWTACVEGQATVAAVEVTSDFNSADHGSTKQQPGEVAKKIAPGLFMARGKFNLQGEGSTKVLMPIPLSYRDQVPLNYELEVRPPGKIAGTRVYEDKPGNWVAELSLRDLVRSKPIDVEWKSVVLVGPSDFSGVPKQAERPSVWPAEARQWLASTWCVQSGDARIRDMARDIRGDSTDVLKIIEATLSRMKEIYVAQSGRCMSLDAVSALDTQGSCTSCANLVAALLRANYVPARVLSGYPAWSGPLQTHYIVEAYVPGYGWYPIESTMLKAPWSNHQQIAVSIVPPEYEGDAAHSRSQAAPGVPFLSLTERAAGSADFETNGTVDTKRIGCDHEAKVFTNLPDSTSPADWSALLGAARRSWAAWLAGSPSSDVGAGLKAGPSTEALKDVNVEGLRRAIELEHHAP